MWPSKASKLFSSGLCLRELIEIGLCQNSSFFHIQSAGKIDSTFCISKHNQLGLAVTVF